MSGVEGVESGRPADEGGEQRERIRCAGGLSRVCRAKMKVKDN